VNPLMQCGERARVMSGRLLVLETFCIGMEALGHHLIAEPRKPFSRYGERARVTSGL
jgi:hypothetical protein